MDLRSSTAPHRPLTTVRGAARRAFRRRSTAVAAIVAVAFFADLPAASAAPAVSVDRVSVTVPAEYFTHEVGDAMDFDSVYDFDTTPRHMVQGGSASMGNGTLTVSGSGQIFLLRTDAGSYPTRTNRDPRAIPLDAGKYRRISIRMHSSENAAAALGFRNCLEPGCVDGTKYFNLVAGWHTYDLDMTGSADFEVVPGGAPPVAGAPWSGLIKYLYLSPAFNVPNKPTLTIDDVRIYEPAENINVTVAAGGGSGTELWSQANGHAENLVGRIGTNRNIAVSAGILRPGTLTRFFTRDGGTTSASSALIDMPPNSRPTPWVLSPSAAGGGDWATEVRGDPWDFEQVTDAYGVANANFSVSDGWGHGSTAGPTVNDPALYLNLNGASIDSTLYHKAVFTLRYDGPWGLEDAPGGGMNARLMWHLHGAPPGAYQISDDLVVMTGENTYEVDLRTSPHHAILDPAGNPAPFGWGNHQAPFIDQIRLDPHEDRGARGWHISDFKLLRNENASPGFHLRFQDRTWTPGTVADIEIDNDRNPANGGVVRVATNHPVGAGVNTVHWDSTGTPPGAYWVNVTLRNPAGVSTTVYSTGQVDVGQRSIGTPPGASHLPPVTKLQSAGDISGWIRLIYFIYFVCAPKPVRVGRRIVRRSPCPAFNTPKGLAWWG